MNALNYNWKSQKCVGVSDHMMIDRDVYMPTQQPDKTFQKDLDSIGYDTSWPETFGTRPYAFPRRWSSTIGYKSFTWEDTSAALQLSSKSSLKSTREDFKLQTCPFV